MTPKRLRFVAEYMVDHNGTAAAVRAGYSSKSAPVIACRLLGRSDIAGAIRSEEGKIEEQLELNKGKVIDGLLSAVDMAETQQNPHAMIAAWREIGKMCGHYEPERKQVDISLASKRLISRFEQMSEGELMAIVAKGNPTSK